MRDLIMQKWLLKTLFILGVIFSLYANAAEEDPLPSWKDGPIKKSLINFVKETITYGNPHFVPREDRIATFDNDGTLWVEQPIYTQVKFAIDRLKELAPQHPEWQQQAPFQAILNGHYEQLTLQDFEKILAVTHSGMTVEAFKEIEQHWLATTKDPHFDRYYTQLIYQPMLEVIHYLQHFNFKVYIVSGGGQDFMRTFSQQVYGIPVERVIGTSTKTQYTYLNGQPELIKQPSVLLIDDHQGKPEAINLFIGKKPIIAFGNSDGDQQMLEWTESGPGKRLMFLVHHDDATREFAYDTQTKVGTFSQALMQEAKKRHWQIISMKNDWLDIFPQISPSQ